MSPGQYSFKSDAALNQFLYETACAYWKTGPDELRAAAVLRAADVTSEAEASPAKGQHAMQSSVAHAEELVAALSWSSPAVPVGVNHSHLHAQLVQLAWIATLDGQALARRRGALLRVVELVRTVFPTAQLEIFGSSSTGLTLPSSDIDLVAIIPNASSATKPLKKLEDALRRAGHSDWSLHQGGLTLILNAKVPLLKFVERESGLHFDLCANSTNGVENSTYIRERLVKYPAMRPLLIALKCVLQQHGLHDTFTGGIGSYLLFLMALRVIERIWERGIEASFGVSSHDRIGDLGKQLRAVLRTYTDSNALQIYDPLSQGQKDIGSRAFRFGEVRQVFRAIARQLDEADCLSAVLRGWPAGHSTWPAASHLSHEQARAAGFTVVGDGLPSYDALMRFCKTTFRKPPVGRDLSNGGGGRGGGKRDWRQKGQLGRAGGSGKKMKGGGGGGMANDGKKKMGKGGGNAAGGRRYPLPSKSAIKKPGRKAKSMKGGGIAKGKRGGGIAKGKR